MGICHYGPGVGFPNRRQHLLPCRKFAQIPGRRVCTDFSRYRCISGDDDVAVGPQGDLCGLFRQVHDDHCGTRRFIADCEVFMERNAVVMAASSVRLLTDRAPAIVQMLWERHGILPRNLILVEVTHPKSPTPEMTVIR